MNEKNWSKVNKKAYEKVGSYYDFCRPNFEIKEFKELIERGYFGVDMHVHSCYSPDSSTSVESLLLKAKKEGFGLAITDHNSVEGSLLANKLATSESRFKNILVIPGVEVTCSEGVHILFYFYSFDDLKKFNQEIIIPNLLNAMRLTISHFELLKRVKKYSCLISAAHPFGSGSCGLYKLNKHADLDVLEGINGTISHKKNIRIQTLGVETHKKFTAGSDAHVLDYVGSVAVFCKNKSIKGVLDSIKKGQVIICGSEIGFFRYIKVNFNKELSLLVKMGLKNYAKNRSLSILSALGLVKLRGRFSK
ncbi:hypothetical protein COV13_03080 [Candidatus Woesearchaeota archaeon CG10_big_fil_rev_8_21_14_0_10_32_9]|nr:MAG: hypothetical protein COV13_03080 [Candidatus Woesearchaeota archaeon CG10_big_fil_rev_8_21_14_0_10_32_9]